ncbi:hypothetical protein OSB04_029896 [Centaurea solstitialis]|uniref:Uncharacterized protein n=1 Tax=Centaurea solstitialis TaxID=347529 RepID=A0AA38S7E0_9ASTR|nr:hypothetical protein OSB04_029896 [Centaurea solstitialis]
MFRTLCKTWAAHCVNLIIGDIIEKMLKIRAFFRKCKTYDSFRRVLNMMKEAGTESGKGSGKGSGKESGTESSDDKPSELSTKLVETVTSHVSATGFVGFWCKGYLGFLPLRSVVQSLPNWRRLLQELDYVLSIHCKRLLPKSLQ